MSPKTIFQNLSPTQQAELESEAMQKYDPQTVKASHQKWKQYSAAEQQHILDEGNAVYAGLLAALPHGPASPQAQAGVERWRRHLEYFWSPDDEQLLGLADLYNEDPRFKANFDQFDPRLAGFVRQAVQAYVAARRQA
ncbi:MAG: TipAS antibiotic-recognition domain-containing protein [Anaerolineaceae bacterium]|nr:TipAS antibiotic-recognition domain-containing protein [Anaerolineaceae bacterium]